MAIRLMHLVAALLALTAAASRAAGPEFEREVAPLVIERCLGCHNASEVRGGLDLTHRDGALTGGESGAAVLPGDAESSYLIHRVREGEMPPAAHGKRLTAEEVDVLARWVDAGAPWPDERVLSALERTTDRRAGRDWWSLQPVVRPTPPPADDPAWQGPIDRFLRAKLDAASVAPSPEADRATLLRRLKFDLVGLPATPEEIDSFVTDPAPDAYERRVDELLASPHYGERWARHWLDVVRFGETNGYETNTPRGNAWPYRDWVIQALNDDITWPDFILAQLAGDQIGIDPATGYLVGGTHDTVGNATLEGTLQQRQDDLNDMVSTTGLAFLGMSVGCARCHDHKFDCIAQRDYYRLQGMFAGVFHGERAIRPADYEERLRNEAIVRSELAALDRQLAELEPLANPSPEADAAPARSPVDAGGNVERFAPVLARGVRFTIAAANQFEPCVDELEVFSAEATPRNVALAASGGKPNASSSYQGASIHQLAHINDGQYGNSHSWICGEPTGFVEIHWPEAVAVDRIGWARDRERRFEDRLPTSYRIELADASGAWVVVASSDDRATRAAGGGGPASDGAALAGLTKDQIARRDGLNSQRQRLLGRLPTAGGQVFYCGTFQAAEPTRLLRRGNPMDPQDALAPGGIAAVRPALELPADAPEAQRRLALARWLGDPANPLVPRVAVNRVWQFHFGRGLVDTPSDFGFNGSRPTHPELLDWLAAEFTASGGRLKHLHRLIVTSSAYRQSSRPRPEAVAVDADSRLLWRYPPHRLEAEAVRDAVLATSGALDRRMGGPGYDVFEPNTNYVHVYIPKRAFGPGEWRRMIYQFKPRMQQDATFGEFDCPDASQSIGRRQSSTTALQALNLLNSPFMVQQATLFAERVVAEVGEGRAAQVDRAFRLALVRAPADDERAAAVALVEQHGLPALCRALFNANEFLYVD